jgi:hypothetical protein
MGFDTGINCVYLSFPNYTSNHVFVMNNTMFFNMQKHYDTSANENAWDYVVGAKLQRSYGDYRFALKKRHYNPYKEDWERFASIERYPIDALQFAALCEHWESKEFEVYISAFFNLT